jgi:hypothetical protein
MNRLSTYLKSFTVAAALLGAAPAMAGNAPISMEQLSVGSPVYAKDGVKIGEINRIKADSDGTVMEIDVTEGGAAGLGRNVVVIKPDEIASVTEDATKLTLTSEEAKKLPVLDASASG